MWQIHMKLPDTKGAICLKCCYTLSSTGKRETEVILRFFRFYCLGKHKTGIYLTVVHVYIVHSRTKTAPPEALYRVWVCAVGSCRLCIRRITRSAHVGMHWCKLCLCGRGGRGMPFYVFLI